MTRSTIGPTSETPEAAGSSAAHTSGMRIAASHSARKVARNTLPPGVKVEFVDPTVDQERAVIYARTSHKSADQDPASQLLTMLQQAAFRNLAVDHIEIEKGSASRARLHDRPGWARVMSRAADARAIITWEQNRGTRDPREFQQIMDDLEAAGVLWVQGSSERDFSKPDDRLVGTIQSATDAQFIDKLSASSRRGIQHAILDGRPAGRIPYGYRPVRDSSGRRVAVELNPDTAPVVGRIFAEFADGLTPALIAGGLNADGIPGKTGTSPWNIHAVKGTLVNPFYAGLRSYRPYRGGRGTVRDAPAPRPRFEPQIVDVPGSWPAIISPDEWHRLFAKVTRGPAPSRESTSLLSGIAKCAKCGKGMVSVTASGGRIGRDGKRLTWRAYRCPRTPGVSTAGHSSIKADVANSIVQARLLERLTVPESRAAVARARRRLSVGDTRALHEEREAIRTEISEAEALVARFPGHVSTLAAVLDRVSPRLSELDTLLAGDKNSDRADRDVSLLLAADDVAAAWFDMPLAGQRAVLASWCRVEIRKPTHGGEQTDEERARQVRTEFVD